MQLPDAVSNLPTMSEPINAHTYQSGPWIIVAEDGRHGTTWVATSTPVDLGAHR